MVRKLGVKAKNKKVKMGKPTNIQKLNAFFHFTVALT
jgi:hypothetical protein